MMNTMGKKSLRVMAGLALCLGLQACDYLPVGYVKVEDVARNPANFEGREVKLKGVVKNTWRLSSVDTKAYLLGEGGATVTVTTTGDLPREGDIIAIRGKVSSLAILGGVGLGTTVQETEKLQIRPAPGDSPALKRYENGGRWYHAKVFSPLDDHAPGRSLTQHP